MRQAECGSGPAGPTDDQLLELFLDLARIASPFGRERALADYVSGRIAGAGLAVEEDAAGALTGGDCGNLLVRVTGRGVGLPILLCAHLDTVAVEGPIEPLVDGAVVRSRADTILGADDKVAVAALMALLEELADERPGPDIEVLFTVSEEVGLRGAAAFDMSRLRARAGIVLDSNGPLGSVIVAGPAQRRITAELRGTAAHAGLDPERGHSAILAASRAISAMKLGRIDEETTANIGVIGGGVATNIVPERCLVSGEARSLSRQRLAAQLEHMIGALHLAAADVGVDVSVDVAADYDDFHLPTDSLPARLAAEALARQGIEPRFVGAGGGSDANALNARGLPTVNLSAGYERAHSPDEYVPVARLAQLHRLVSGLVQAAEASATG